MIQRRFGDGATDNVIGVHPSWPACNRGAARVVAALLILFAAPSCGSVPDDRPAASGTSGGPSTATSSTTGAGGANTGTAGATGTGGTTPLDDCSAPTTTVLADKQEQITSVALDAETVYWGNQDLDANRILTIPKAGGNVAILATTPQPSTNLVVDDTRVYWSEDTGDTTTIYSVAKASGPSTPAQLAMTTTGACSGLSVDSDHVYWASGHRIYSLPKSGGAAPTEFVKPSPVMNYDRRGVLADHDRVYWLEGNARIVSLPRSGVGPQHITSLVSHAHRFVIGAYEFYLGDPLGVPQDSGELFATPKDGGAGTVLVGAMDGVVEIAVNSSCVYWTTSQNGIRLQAVPALGGDPVTLAQVGASGAVIAADESGVYWGERDTHRLMRAIK